MCLLLKSSPCKVLKVQDKHWTMKVKKGHRRKLLRLVSMISSYWTTKASSRNQSRSYSLRCWGRGSSITCALQFFLSTLSASESAWAQACSHLTTYTSMISSYKTVSRSKSTSSSCRLYKRSLPIRPTSQILGSWRMISTEKLSKPMNLLIFRHRSGKRVNRMRSRLELNQLKANSNNRKAKIDGFNRSHGHHSISPTCPQVSTLGTSSWGRSS